MTTSHTNVGDAQVPAKLAITELAEMKRQGTRIAMVTAYDAAGGRLAEAAGMDIVLVGDSAAMVVLGHDSTVPVTMDEMLFMTRSVSRAVSHSLVVGDMPFGSYQVSDADAVRNAIRFVKEGGADTVKLEGAGRMLPRVRAIVESGIPVMGHIGLTPQSVTAFGGYKAQGRTAAKAKRLVADALALQEAGCYSLVLEAVPTPVAARITEALTIPTIGIGAGPACDGQVLVYHDLLGLTEGHTARFVKRYADLATVIREALAAFVADIRSGAYPEDRHTYGMPADELAAFEASFGGEGQAAAMRWVGGQMPTRSAIGLSLIAAFVLALLVMLRDAMALSCANPWGEPFAGARELVAGNAPWGIRWPADRHRHHHREAERWHPAAHARREARGRFRRSGSRRGASADRATGRT